MTVRSSYTGLLLWCLAVVFFAFQFTLRLYPGLMIDHLIHRFSIGASQFGLLAASYYVGYAGAQIPLALILERYAVPSVLMVSCAGCGLATWWFSHTDDFWIGLFCRMLTGIGSAAAFLAISKTTSRYFPAERYSRLIGLSFSVGLLGAVYGGAPLSVCMEHYGFTQVAQSLSLVAFLMMGCAALLIDRNPNDPIRQHANFHHLWVVLRTPALWALALSNLLLVGSLEGFADVWRIKYFMVAYAIPKSAAAGLTSFVFVGMIFGGPILTLLSSKWQTHRVIIACSVLMAIILSVLLSHPSYHRWLLVGLCFLLGVLCCYQVLVFSLAAQTVGKGQLGITVAFLNCMNMLGGCFFHTIIGRGIDYWWSGAFDRFGSRIYSVHAYQMALSVIPIAAVVATTIVYARQRH